MSVISVGICVLRNLFSDRVGLPDLKMDMADNFLDTEVMKNSGSLFLWLFQTNNLIHDNEFLPKMFAPTFAA